MSTFNGQYKLMNGEEVHVQTVTEGVELVIELDSQLEPKENGRRWHPYRANLPMLSGRCIAPVCDEQRVGLWDISEVVRHIGRAGTAYVSYVPVALRRTEAE